MKTKQKGYQVQARINLLTAVGIVANDLDEALLKAKGLDIINFIDLVGENIDYDLELTGVYTSE